jgi:hypothetical protein
VSPSRLLRIGEFANFRSSHATRTVFWSLYAYDKGASFAFGRPYMILDQHIDVHEPANADISLMAEDSTEPIVSKPIEEPTPYSKLRAPSSTISTSSI